MSRKAKRGVGSCSSRAVPTGTPWCPAAAPRVLDGDAGSVSRRSEEPRSGTARSLRVQRVLLVCSVSGQLLEKYCIFSELHLRSTAGAEEGVLTVAVLLVPLCGSAVLPAPGWFM